MTPNCSPNSNVTMLLFREANRRKKTTIEKKTFYLLTIHNKCIHVLLLIVQVRVFEFEHGGLYDKQIKMILIFH